MLEKLEKKFGKKRAENFKYFLTGIKSIKIPQGCMTEIRGRPESDKLFFALDMLKYCRDSVIIDADHTVDPLFLDVFHLDKSKIWIANPLDFSQNFELIHNLLEIKNLGVFIIVNSILSLFPQDKEYQQLANNFEKIQNQLKNSENSLIILNPYTEKRYNILNNYCDLIIHLEKRRTIVKNYEKIGYFVEGKVLKNTLNLELPKFYYKMLYSNGLQELDSL